MSNRKELQKVLRELNTKSTSPRQKGEYFEKLMLNYFKQDSHYKPYFKNVWLWGDKNNPYAKGQDIGIDLVAESNAGDVYAIQCKFYHENHELKKEDIDSFFNELGKKPYTKGIIVSTTNRWSDNATKSLNKRSKPCQRIGIGDLENSDVDWKNLLKVKTPSPRKKIPRNHQKEAISLVKKGFQDKNRGKLIMPCGTGKTFTSLKIADEMVPPKGTVLFLVPSLSLLSQTLREWTQNTQRHMNCFVVCSDSQVGKNDDEDIQTTDLVISPTTDAKKLDEAMENTQKNTRKNANAINVIFSTYHSLKVVSEAQKKRNLKPFDLVICDEAHRTTGIEGNNKNVKSSFFTKIHDEDFIVAKKRLYMTATPRIYSESSKKKANENEIKVYSMDDPKIYGEEFYRLDFSKAIEKNLLSDYKVSVLAISEDYVQEVMQKDLSQNSELNTSDVVKIVGCWNALSGKLISTSEDKKQIDKIEPMKRAVAFSGTIKASKHIKDNFGKVVNLFLKNNPNEKNVLKCELHHVDGTQNSLIRNRELSWLKDDISENECRILTNARCLSEGVDVPALDAVMFLNPRKSEVDIVQSVGRVMRKADGKKYGYIILPIVIPAGISPEKALDDNKTYQVVWQVLQALRSHDDSFDAMINQMEFNKKISKKINIIGIGGGEQSERNENGETNADEARQIEFDFPIHELRKAMYAKIVIKCGDRHYLDILAKDISKISNTLSNRLKINLKNAQTKDAFNDFLDSLRQNLNDSITENDAIEMLSQHMLTKPIFDALFSGFEFSKNNPISKSMEEIVSLLDSSTQAETKDLNAAYASIKKRVKNIDNLEGKQRVIKEIYEKVFKEGFPKIAKRLGIVYTPIEIVDFILQSTDEILKKEFNTGLTNKGVHILDPFSGTGSFLTRLIELDLIKDKDLEYKYKNELHANEFVLLAYYITTINIENAYYFRKIINNKYHKFNGAVFTDTFQMFEEQKKKRVRYLRDNIDQREKQKKESIQVIIGNPPYSAGQKSQNDNNKNLKYKKLDEAIKNTYAEDSVSQNLNKLYDSYIRALRLATDRVGNKGIVSFVTNGSFIESSSADGLRCHLAKDFTSLYIFNLRGNQRTKGEQSRKEGGKIFGASSRTPVAISFLVKNPNAKGCTINYYDIGDYLNREKKLKEIRKFKDISKMKWNTIKPNKNYDWINQRDESYEKFLPLGDKKESIKGLFTLFSNGVVTNRDAWAYSHTKESLEKNMESMIDTYNKELELLRYNEQKDKPQHIGKFLTSDATKISWSSSLKTNIVRGKKYKFDKSKLRLSLYRPFSKQYLYYCKDFNERRYLTYKIFPTPETKNLAICVSGSSNALSTLITDTTPDLQTLFNGQCFPRHYYENGKKIDNISSEMVKKFQDHYKNKKIDGDAIFYYVYGLFHSKDYRNKYSSNFGKTLPRIPFCNNFTEFSKTGRELAEIHLNYETVKKYPSLKIEGRNSENLRVHKMKFADKKDKSVIDYNDHIKISEIPTEAYEYKLNGRSAIEWIMDRYQVKTDKNSKLRNDPNSLEAPSHILELLQRIVTVSMESLKLINALPKIKEVSYPDEKELLREIKETKVERDVMPKEAIPNLKQLKKKDKAI